MVSRRVVRGGLVADGVAAEVRPADVLVEDGMIVAVGPDVGERADAAVLDLVAGSVVCPGFIDAQVHAEGPLVADGVVTGALAQGVTTLVVGQDGSSWVGAAPEAAGMSGGTSRRSTGRRRQRTGTGWATSPGWSPAG